MMKKTSPLNYRRGFRKLIAKDRGFIERGMYYKQIQERVVPFFSLDNFHVSIQERMATDVNKELNSVYDFLGVDRINKEVEDISAKSKDVFIDNYKKWHSKYPPMSESDRAYLTGIYREANNKFFEFYGDVVDEWNG